MIYYRNPESKLVILTYLLVLLLHHYQVFQLFSWEVLFSWMYWGMESVELSHDQTALFACISFHCDEGNHSWQLQPNNVHTKTCK